MPCFVRSLVLLIWWVFPASVLAQSQPVYPLKAVRIIVPFPPGGTTDVLARLMASGLERRFNQAFLVENRPGATTAIGTELVVKSANDGHTLLMSVLGVVADEQVLSKEWPFKFERDMTAISLFASGGYVLAVSNQIPVTNLRELVAYSKANPGKLNQAQSSGEQPDMAILKHRLGMGPTVSVVYKGGAPATMAVISGEAHFFGGAMLTLLEPARAGKLRIIAYTERDRHPAIPQVPTVNESGVGINDFDASYWNMLIGPAAFSEGITAKLNSAMVDMIKTPEFADKVSAFGMRVHTLSPVESLDLVRARIKLLEQYRAAGVKLR